MSEHSPVTAIPEDTCWQLLHEEEFGRLAFHLADEVHLVPINYAVDARRRIVALQLAGHEADEIEQLPLRPWIDTAKFNTIAIEVDEVTGRHFELTRPWLHMRPQPEA